MAFSASVISKAAQPNGTIKVTVEFTDGVKTFTEEVTPQDREGFDYFVSGRLKALNFAANGLSTGPVVPAATGPTAAEQARANWISKVSRYSRTKSLLVDTGIFTVQQAKLVALADEIKAEALPEYLPFI